MFRTFVVRSVIRTASTRQYYYKHSNRSYPDYQEQEAELLELEGIAREREVVKNVYKESIITASRSDTEIEEFMQKHKITVEREYPRNENHEHKKHGRIIIE